MKKHQCNILALVLILLLFLHACAIVAPFSLKGKSNSLLKVQESQGISSKPNLKKIDIIGQGTNLGFILPVSGSEFLGAGYDIFEGNPDGTLRSSIDPGYRDKVVVVEFEDYQEGHRAPTNGYLYRENACAYSSKVTKTQSGSKYEEELDKQSSLEVKIDLLIVKVNIRFGPAGIDICTASTCSRTKA